MSRETATTRPDLVSIGELAESLCRDMGYGGSPHAKDAAEYGWQVASLQNIILEMARKGEIRLYRSDRPYPFLFGGLDSPDFDLRLAAIDVEKVQGMLPMLQQEAENPLLTGNESDTNDAVSGTPKPLVTTHIAHCFEGLHWDESGWRKVLGKKPKWLAPSVVLPGQRGSRETQWDPVSVGAALIRMDYAKARSVRAKFQSVHLLRNWLEAWKTYEADHFLDK